MTTEQTGGARTPGTSTTRRLWLLIEVVNVRLRFIFLMVIVGLVVGYWETITNYYDRWRRPAQAGDMVATEAIEFYCPMHPNVVRGEAGNCPICGMPLRKRAKTAEAALPQGVLARQHLTPLQVRIGRIATSPVEYRLLAREVRTVGIVEYDETRRAFIAARIKGRIDELMVNYVGQRVERGEVLAKIYSPELLTAQQELLTAYGQLRRAEGQNGLAATTARSLVEASRQKLLLWGITGEQIDEIVRRGTVDTHLIIHSPIGGFVTDKKVLPGRYVNEGDDLYTVADLSVVWMQAKIFEDEIAGIHVGTAVEVTSTAHPNEVFAGRIAFIAYQVDPATRTVAARVEISNPEFKLKPGMYAHAIIRVPLGQVSEIDPEEALAAGTTQPTGVRAADTSALTGAYLALTSALAADQTDAAAVEALIEAAEDLAKRTDGAIGSRARAIAAQAVGLRGKDLSAQRGLLQALSAAVIELLRDHPPAGVTLYVAHCPMVEADWLQDAEPIANPYMGGAMLRCGELTGTIEPKAIQEAERHATGYFCPVTPDRLYEHPALCPIDKFPLKFVRIEKTLAVPESAVISTGTRKIVYRESGPGTFDMIEVRLGARADGFYPVLSGIQAGERVATAGAFLVDAENRLNPAAGAQYFGASDTQTHHGEDGGHGE